MRGSTTSPVDACFLGPEPLPLGRRRRECHLGVIGEHKQVQPVSERDTHLVDGGCSDPGPP